MQSAVGPTVMQRAGRAVVQTSSRRPYSAQSFQREPFVVFVSGEKYDPPQNPLLGPSKQFPLPGGVAPKFDTFQAIPDTNSQPPLRVPTANLGAILSTGRVDASRDYLEKASEEIRAVKAAMRPPSATTVELHAQACPRLLMRDLKALWPTERFPQERQINVLNLSQKTENDMAAWSRDMDTERERLTLEFVESALAVCTTLQRCGYWADFIDPSSGRPYLSGYTNATLFETHDAYRHMGFQIEDLGCCKVLKHAVWGSKAFVGTIFTDAPLNAEIVQDIVKKVNSEKMA